MTYEGKPRAQSEPRMRVLAHAKINLSLEVLGRREDGYHQVVTVLHTIGMADRLSFESFELLSLDCERLSIPTEQNLVMRAARLLQQHTGCTLGAAIILEKGIPAGSGLGGGSSDAATTLKALNALWGLKLSSVKLHDLAAQLGSDVPFFLEEGCALAEGRGEDITPLQSATGLWAVVLVPPFQMPDKTAHLYGLLSNSDFTDGTVTKKVAERLRTGVSSLGEGGVGMNAFERAAMEAFPGLEVERKALIEAGAPFARVTGSGPALFTLVESQEDGLRITGRLEESARDVYLVRVVGTSLAR
ncbi:MAG: 4-(cytidine 5'-diphospho)-2-C-methyl-D-erythritol kinase [Dehalococcoidia bacterium]